MIYTLHRLSFTINSTHARTKIEHHDGKQYGSTDNCNLFYDKRQTRTTVDNGGDGSRERTDGNDS